MNFETKDPVYIYSYKIVDDQGPKFNWNDGTVVKITETNTALFPYEDYAIAYDESENKTYTHENGIEWTGTVDLTTPGTYPVVYTVTDGAGNTTTQTLTVEVSEALPIMWYHDYTVDSNGAGKVLSESIAEASLTNPYTTKQVISWSKGTGKIDMYDATTGKFVKNITEKWPANTEKTLDEAGIYIITLKDTTGKEILTRKIKIAPYVPEVKFKDGNGNYSYAQTFMGMKKVTAEIYGLSNIKSITAKGLAGTTFEKEYNEQEIKNLVSSGRTMLSIEFNIGENATPGAYFYQLEIKPNVGETYEQTITILYTGN